MNNLEISRSRNVVPFNRIIGVSDYNPRYADEADDGIDSLAASILSIGQLEPLFVQAEGQAYVVLDGSRRWRAMCRLVAQGDWNDAALIDVELLTGSEATLREIALAPNTLRRALHPVEEFEAFVSMARAGYTEERIAKAFGLGLKHVKQRLALGRLHPKILHAWHSGEIDADIAKAFCTSESLDAQEALFDESRENITAVHPSTIRTRLRRDGLSSTAAEAIYVGGAAYLAAGGRLHESLFEEETFFLDGSLLKKLAREKLLAEGEAIAAEEGWGFVIHEDDEDIENGDFSIEPPEYDYTAEEIERLEELDDPLEDESAEDFADRAAIETRGALRTFNKVERGNLGLFVQLNPKGLGLFTRGWQRFEADDTEDNDVSPTPPTRAEKKGAVDGNGLSTSAAPEKDPRKPVRECLNLAIDKALNQTIRIRPDIAMLLLVAKLGSEWNDLANAFSLSGTRNYKLVETDHPLLKAIGEKPFTEALRLCADTPLCDLTTALAELVAGLIHADQLALLADHALPRALVARGADLRGALNNAFDSHAYFDVATKDAALGCLMDLETPAVEKTAKKDALAKTAADEAARKHWLPQPLAAWAALQPTSPEASAHLPPQPQKPARKPKKSLAQAMNEAIAADEGHEIDDAGRAAIVDDIWIGNAHAIAKQFDAPELKCFLIDIIIRSDVDDVMIKASDLYDAYIIHVGRYPDVESFLSVQTFSQALIAMGIEKKRLKNGVHYLGIALKEPAALDEQEREPA
jgi:ParB family chromosome partitioning protein